MNKLETFLASASVLALMAAGDPAFAQQSTNAVTPTGTINAGPAFWATPTALSTVCAATANTSASETITITPGSNQYVYITGVYIDITANVTGNTAAPTASFTNVGGSPIYSLATVTATAGANGTFRQIAETYNPPIRSTTAGTAVVWQTSATLNSTIVCPRIAAYIAQ